MAIAALILGIVAFFFNPLYGCSIAAIILGAISKAKTPSTFAQVGFVLGIVSLACQLAVDVVSTVFSGGIGIFTCCL